MNTFRHAIVVRRMTDRLPDAELSPATPNCDNERVDRDQATTRRVRDAMVTRPKTIPADATVGTLRALFEDPHVACSA